MLKMSLTYLLTYLLNNNGFSASAVGPDKKKAHLATKGSLTIVLPCLL